MGYKVKNPILYPIIDVHDERGQFDPSITLMEGLFLKQLKKITVWKFEVTVTKTLKSRIFS